MMPEQTTLAPDSERRTIRMREQGKTTLPPNLRSALAAVEGDWLSWMWMGAVVVAKVDLPSHESAPTAHESDGERTVMRIRADGKVTFPPSLRQELELTDGAIVAWDYDGTKVRLTKVVSHDDLRAVETARDREVARQLGALAELQSTTEEMGLYGQAEAQGYVARATPD